VCPRIGGRRDRPSSPKSHDPQTVGGRRFESIEMWSGGRTRHADIWSEGRERVQVEEFAPFYDFALRRINIESKGGILCNLLFLLIGGREGIEPPTRGFSARRRMFQGFINQSLTASCRPLPKHTTAQLRRTQSELVTYVPQHS
jgi:hypothetical protein